MMYLDNGISCLPMNKYFYGKKIKVNLYADTMQELLDYVKENGGKIIKEDWIPYLPIPLNRSLNLIRGGFAERIDALGVRDIRSKYIKKGFRK